MRNDQPMMVYDIHLELYIRLRSFLIQLFWSQILSQQQLFHYIFMTSCWPLHYIKVSFQYIIVIGDSIPTTAFHYIFMTLLIFKLDKGLFLVSIRPF
jgi:hypothetical protein